MKKLLFVALIAFMAGIVLQAQSEGPRMQYVVGTVTGCTLVSGQSVFCFTTGNSTTSAALYVSSVGGAFTQVGAPQNTGVTSITVNGGTAQTGAVALTIPKQANLPASTLTLQ